MTDRLDDHERQMLKEHRSQVIQTPGLIRRLETIQGLVEHEWSQHTGPPWHPFHGPSHSFQVEEKLYDLIPEERRKRLSEEEWFYLLAAAWLHDIGMIIKEERVDFKHVRN